MSAQVITHAPREIPKRTSEELLFVGQRCNHDACSLVDFLPFKCQYCSQPYCGSHFLPSTHTCPSLPHSHTLDRIAPLCPICSIPIATFPGEDPNGPMERHFSSGKCGVAEDKKAEARRRRERGEVCWRKGCGKVLIAKIKCESCGRYLCPPHRFPKDHQCASLTSSSSTANSSSSSIPARLNPVPAPVSAPGSAFLNIFAGIKNAFPSSSKPTGSGSVSSVKPVQARNQPSIAGPRQAAAMAAMKRFGQTPVTNSVPQSKTSLAASSSKSSTPMSSATQPPKLKGSAQVVKTPSRKSNASGEEGSSSMGGGLKKMFSKLGPVPVEEK